MLLCFTQNLDSRVQITKVIVQKRRRSGGYVEAFGHVLSDSEASETYGYLVWVILGATKLLFVHTLISLKPSYSIILRIAS